MQLFNHVQIKVKDLKKSRQFYDCVMAALGYNVVLEINAIVIGYGTNVHDMFEIRQFDQNSPKSEHVHLAFNASCKKDVDLFYLNALKNGGICNGKPGLRPQYENGYYAAFVTDPDGHNIEAIYSENADSK